MTVPLVADPTGLQNTGLFRPVPISSDTTVWVGLVSTPADLRACLTAVRSLPVSTLHLVLHYPHLTTTLLDEPLGEPRVQAGCLALTCVCPDDTDRSLLWSRLWDVCRADGSNIYLAERDPVRAVVEELKWVRPEHGFVILWPAEPGYELVADLLAGREHCRAMLTPAVADWASRDSSELILS